MRPMQHTHMRRVQIPGKGLQVMLISAHSTPPHLIKSPCAGIHHGQGVEDQHFIRVAWAATGRYGAPRDCV